MTDAPPGYPAACKVEERYGLRRGAPGYHDAELEPIKVSGPRQMDIVGTIPPPPGGPLVVPPPPLPVPPAAAVQNVPAAKRGPGRPPLSEEEKARREAERAAKTKGPTLGE